VDWHLLQHVGGETYQLHELIREFFREKLEGLTQASNFKQSIATCMATLARDISDTPSGQITQSIIETVPHLTEVAETIDQSQFNETLCWLYVGLARFYNGQGFYTLVEKWCEQGLSIIIKCFNIDIDKIADTDSTLKEAIAPLLLFQGKALRVKGEYSLALEKYQQSIEILQDVQEKTMVVRALRGQGHVYRLQGKHKDSIRNYEESRRLAEVIKFDKGVARAAYGVARIYRLRGELEKAALRYEEARVGFEKLGLPVEEAWATFGLGEVQRMRWILQQSYERYSAALQQFKELGHREGEAYAVWGTGDTNRLLGGIEAEKGNLETALKYLETAKKDYELSLEICQQIADRRSEAWAVLGLAEVSRMEGKYEVSASEKAISKYHDALSKYQRVFSLVSYQECVEEAHALLGIAATKRLLGLQGIISDLGMEINEACEKAINIYQDQNRNMNYCIVDALIERGLYHLIQLNWEQAQLDLEKAENICNDNNYTEEKALINRIKTKKDSSELHILNFP
jgi:tetratricopeptide (TPR) repeat protein